MEQGISCWALLWVLSCCPLCSFSQAAEKSASPGDVAPLTLQDAITAETVDQGSSPGERAHILGESSLLLA